MRCFLPLLLLASSAIAQPAEKPPNSQILELESARRFAKLASLCVHKEYPNKISHTLNSDADVAPPRKLTPAFYGCYDWHSAVHGHWLLARLARSYPEADFAKPARDALRQSITRDNIAQEVRYLQAEGRASFERPYGLAWLLQLSTELSEWGNGARSPWARFGNRSQLSIPPNVSGQTRGEGDAEAAELAGILRPLEKAAVQRLKVWLPKLSLPVRSGEHSQTAFALALMLDYAREAGDEEFEKLVMEKARAFYGKDKTCPLNYEPSGEDFLSPCLAEADLMRRVLPWKENITWLQAFLPQIFAASTPHDWLSPAIVTDPSDPKLAHLDGLNLSRAWMLAGVASAIQNPHLRMPLTGPQGLAYRRLRAAEDAHRTAGLASVTGKHYEGGHWLGSFAVYLVTGRGIQI
jgi:hypothetical protein